MNRTEPDTLDLGGGADVRLPSCTVMVDSSASTAAVAQGSSKLLAAATNVVGGYSGDAFTPTPQTGIQPFTDPLAGVAAPPVGSCDHTSVVTISANRTLLPGTYCGGINIKKGTTTLRPGLYVINEGGLNVASGASIKGEEVTIYNTYTDPKFFQPFNMASNYPNVVQLTAPTSGAYKGVLLFQDRRVTRGYKNYLTKNEGTVYEGYLYFPSSPLRFTGGETWEVNPAKMVLIADMIELRGNIEIVSPGEERLPGGTGDVRLVE